MQYLVTNIVNFFQGQWGTWREEQQIACLQASGVQCVLDSVVPKFPRLVRCARSRQFWQPSEETRFACCRPDSSQLLMGHKVQPIFAVFPKLVLVQLLGQFQVLLLPSSRSGNVAILGPSHSSHRIRAEGVTLIGRFIFSTIDLHKILSTQSSKRNYNSCRASANTSLTDGTTGPKPQATLSLPGKMKRLTLQWTKPEDNSTVCTTLCAPVKSSGNTCGLRTCQTPQEILGFLGPSASDLAGDHHQPRATIPMAQLWVCSFLVLSCLHQCLCHQRGIFSCKSSSAKHPQLCCTLCGGGHKRRVDGHTGRGTL